MRHWLFGGRTDLTNLVLLCDRDHGLVHELDLVMTRSGGRLIVTAPDGRRVWGPADTAFAGGLTGLRAASEEHGESFAGVHPIDTVIGRRPAALIATEDVAADDGDRRPIESSTPATAPRAHPRTPRRVHSAPARRSGGSTHPGGLPRHQRPLAAHPAVGASRFLARPATPIGATLFPAGEPPLPEAVPVNGERMDVRYVVGVLMGNRDLVRRLAAETGGVPAGTP
jgi:hypothetical protein